MPDLSILIPSRNEMFLAKTVEDILSNIEGDTEIIVVLDGAWADPALPDHDRVKIIYNAESVGQRAATNQAARLSTAKYVAKTDAHCAFDKGFDVKLMAKMQDDWTMVPIMRNLHVFDWVCPKGHRRYQGPSCPCTECGEPTIKDVVWIPKKSPQSRSYCFDPTPHFQYFNEYTHRPEYKDSVEKTGLSETMSLQGSFFMMTREKYWELGMNAEEFGSWGSQGLEIAIKTWLSGGRVLVNHNTWYSHCFRTAGGDFSFPYSNPQSKVEKAKKTAHDLFWGNKYDKAIRPLSWLVEKFWPVQGWADKDLQNLKRMESNKGIIFFTDNQLPLKIAHRVQKQLRKATYLPIVTASLKPMSFGDKNIVINEQRGYLTMFKQILAALEASSAEIIFFAEHDVLYPKEHFDFTPTDKNTFYYNQNWWKIREDGFAVRWDADQVSGLCAYRDILIEHYKQRIASFDKDNFDRKFEPMSGVKSVAWKSSVPYIDIRHKRNLTYNKWSLDKFRNKSTAVNFETSTVDKIPDWDLKV